MPFGLIADMVNTYDVGGSPMRMDGVFGLCSFAKDLMLLVVVEL